MQLSFTNKMSISPGLLVVVCGGEFSFSGDAGGLSLGLGVGKLTTRSDISAQFMTMLTFYRLLKPQ